ncbi:glycosyltransferase family 4 protein [Pontibacter cellulosilyticus]|uniref:Glycosyltransferase family 4 protein n=1 Tax=Pontibacter cellulosilyticus TaxID=1720253 RepID=A0A923N922_9BACT|nr:glycosyltransferase family 4 protein [Pontibacter cellulosilyticus]MBC5995068.1 glycosyltransferase family 4 protein [Pontibacter cellulosilyticus]
MKIAFISSGTFTHIQSYIDFFKEQGHEVYFIALSPSPQRNVPVLQAWIGKETKFNLVRDKWKYLLAAFKAKKIVRGLKPDIVHGHYATSAGVALLVCNFQNSVITVHGSDVNSSMKSATWRFILKRIFKSVKYVNVVSNELELKVRSLGVDASKIVNVNVGIDVGKYYKNIGKSSIGDNYKLKIICNRSFEPVYDHFTILKGLKVLQEKEIPYEAVFLGDGSMKESLERFTVNNELQNVKFLGRIPNAEQPYVFSNHNIYVSASLSDGTSLSLLEALASGLFPIVSDIKANRDILQHNRNGLLFPVGDFTQFANCLEELFLQKHVSEDKLCFNQQLVSKVGDRKVNLKKIESLYRSILS